MKLEYQSYEDACKNFRWDEKWELFERGPQELNIAYECVDRHDRGETAIRLKKSDSTTETYTFGELSRLSSQFANMLEDHGIKEGERVGIVLEPCLEYYVSLFGTLKRGAVAVPCYALLGTEGLEYRLRESASVMAIVRAAKDQIINKNIVRTVVPAEELINRLSSYKGRYQPHTSAETSALIQFSSGTSGQPKQVLYSHSAVTVTAVQAKFWLGLRPDDRYMCTSSPAWGHGIWYGAVAPLIFGNGIGAYSGKFSEEILLEALEEFEITSLSAIPRVYQMIMESGKIDNYRLKLRRLTYTGAEMSEEITRYYLDKLGLHIAAAYGNTETGSVSLDFAFDDWQPRIGSSGKPMLGVKVAVLDENGTALPPGELGQIAIWRHDNWVLIGDYGYFDEDGFLWPKGRSDDVIKSSGFRIGPFEIEQVLEKHPAVSKSAVIGSPDKERGEIVKAFIVPSKINQTSDELKLEIQDFVKARLSMHEYPKEITFVDALPETPDGKVMRKRLKEMEYQRKGVVLAK